MRKARRIRIFRGLALGLALAALVAPAAQARVDGSGTQGGARVIQGDDKVIVSTDGGTTAVIRGDDKVIDTTPATYSGFAYRRALPQDDGPFSRAGYRRALPQDYTTAPATEVRSPSTFDWGDAGIGAGGALALLLLAGALTFGVRHRPRPAAA
jgi:hypothetical protein